MSKEHLAATSERPTRPIAARRGVILLVVGIALLAVGIAGTMMLKRPAPAGSSADCDTRQDCTRFCDRKDWVGCTRLAALYWFPKTGRRDMAKAESLYKEACDAGEPSGCYSLGRMYQDALIFAEKAATAPELLRRAAEGFERQCGEGRAQSCLDLAAMQLAGRGVERSPDKASGLQSKAAAILERECAAGAGRSCGALSQLTWGGSGVAKDIHKSFALAERACELSDRRSCVRVGADFLLGRQELGKDPARAAGVYRKACDLGDLPSCHALAHLYRDGAGVALDLKIAAAIEKKACDAEFAPSCRELGRMYGAGEGVKKDTGRQDELYKREVSLRARGCGDGIADDCENLARNYRMDGISVAIDPQRAKEFEEQEFRFRQENCDAGLVMDCSGLRMRLEGRSGQTDRMRAIRERECQLGVKDQCRFLDKKKAPD
jgi:TPR repeat protein